MSTTDLPQRFADLAPFVPEWALTNEHDRYHKLHTVTVEHMRPFYDAMLSRMHEILDFLNEYQISSMPPEVNNLFLLAMTFSEVAHPLDLKWKTTDFTDAYPWERFEFKTVSVTGLQSPQKA